jgi:hypothetical protein
MKSIIPVLASVALVALAGPALAGKSTPQEREATKQLNLEQAQLAKNTTQQIAAAMPNSSMQAQKAPEAAPTKPVESAPAAEQSPAAAPAENSANNAAANAQ